MASIGLKIEKGIANKQDPHKLGQITDWRDKTVKVLSQAQNVDLDDNGEATRRVGRTSRLAATYPHSAFVHPQNDEIAYFVEGGALKKLNTDYTTTTVHTFSADTNCGYEVVNGEVIVSDDVEIGWLSGATFEAFEWSAADDDENAEFYATMWPGRFLAFWNGILWVAHNNLLGFSLPYNIATRDTRLDLIPMDGGIRMLAAVEDGLWLATDKHVSFIKGSGPDDLQFVHVSDLVPAHGCFSVGYESGDKDSSRVVRWASQDGFCTGRAGGAFMNLSPDTALPTGSQGICIEKVDNGITQYIAVIRDDVDGGELYTADTLVINSVNI